MTSFIAILEDNAERRESMAACLSASFPQHTLRFFVTAPATIEFLEGELDRVVVICLDHDLDLIETADGRCLDPGTGREAADWLAQRQPSCGVVIHTTNSPAGFGMKAVLEEAGWTTRRVVPYGDLEWIPEVWLEAVRDLAG